MADGGGSIRVPLCYSSLKSRSTSRSQVTVSGCEQHTMQGGLVDCIGAPCIIRKFRGALLYSIGVDY